MGEVVTGNIIQSCTNGIDAETLSIISGNKITGAPSASYAIQVKSVNNVSVSDNVVTKHGDAVYLQDSIGSVFMGNIFYDNVDGIDEGGTSDYTIAVGNNLRGNSGTNNNVDALHSISEHNQE